MVDPRIYRAGLVLVVVAVFVFGFSLQNEPGGAGTTLLPPSWSPSAAASAVRTLAGEYPDPGPGSQGDQQLAAYVDAQLAHAGLAVTETTASLRTAAGLQPVETVTATHTGVQPGALVILSDRDEPGSAGPAGTAVLLQLAHTLAGETANRTVVLVSTSGAVGAAGAAHLAATLTGQPVDAVIALGDLAAAHATEPVIVPWTDADTLAPPLLTQTLASALRAQAGLSPGSTSLAGQVAHLAVPLALGDQAPFGRAGIPAVMLSTAGNRALSHPGESIDGARVAGIYAALVETVYALDAGPAVPSAEPYLLLSGKIVPMWAVRLLALALILPVGMATVDALARARRRGHSLRRWLGWTLAGVVPFLVALVVILLARLTGALAAVPPGPVDRFGATGGGVPIGLRTVTVLVAVVVCFVLALLLLRPLCVRMAAARSEPASEQPARRRVPASPAADAAAIAVSIVMCLCAIVTWVLNPFAALLLVPALHLWLWLAEPSVRERHLRGVTLAVLGFLPAVLVLVLYAHEYGLGLFHLAVAGLLLVAGGGVPITAALIWSVALGCLVGALVIAIRAPRAAAVAAVETPVTVRGPLGYAGPGSLGGTESALRRGA